MSKLKTLQDLFHHQLRDLYSAEKQLIEALPKMAEKANNQELKDAFKEHLEETKDQKKRLEEIGEILDIDMSGETCKAMKGLIKEAEDFFSEDASKDVRDAGLIADAQRVEHYEIAGYGTVVAYAKALGENEVLDKLEKTLSEESGADKKLNDLAISRINQEAKATG